MKKLIITLLVMLVIMGQRWEYDWEYGGSECSITETIVSCYLPPFRYRLHWVVGEFRPWTIAICHGGDPCGETVERFTIPVPNTATKSMTKDEAESRNRKLMR